MMYPVIDIVNRLAIPARATSVESSFSPRRQPFVYLTGSFTVGILAGRLAEPPLWVWSPAAVVFLFLVLRYLSNKSNQSATLALLICFAASGNLLARAERDSLASPRLRALYGELGINPNEPVELGGVLVRPPEPAPGAVYLDVDAESISVRDQMVRATGRARLFISLAEEMDEISFRRLALGYGSRINARVALERGRRFHNPGSPDFDQYLEYKGYDVRGTIKSPRLIQKVGETPVDGITATLFELRTKMLDVIGARFSPSVSGTLRAMLLDNRYFLDPRAAEQLRTAGTFHVISISGMHVGIIAWLLLGGASKVSRRSRTWIVMVMVVVWAYALMVGLAPPVTRASVMISIGLIGPMLFRRAASMNTVSLAAFVMLAFKPSLVEDPAFQLSFLAVAGIFGLAMPIINKLRAIGEWRPSPHSPRPPSCHRITRAIAETLFWDSRSFHQEMRNSPVSFMLDKSRAPALLTALRLQRMVRIIVTLALTSMAIQLSTLPLMALYFNRITPIGVVLNVAAGLLTATMMVTGTLGVALGTISAWLAAAMASIAEATHAILVNSIAPFTAVPGASFRVAHYEGLQKIAYAGYFFPLAMVVMLIDTWRPVEIRTSLKRRSAPTVALTSRETAFKSNSRNKIIVRRTWSVILLIAVVTVMRPFGEPIRGRLTLHFLDVGQGDAALVVFPNGRTMLVDGGGEIQFSPNRNRPQVAPGNDEVSTNRANALGVPEIQVEPRPFAIGEIVVSRFLWSLGRTRLDYVLATHADIDHIGGLTQVANNFSIGQAVVGRVQPDNLALKGLLALFELQGVPVGSVSAGEKYELDGVTVEVLWPPRVLAQSAGSENDNSVVLRLVYGSVAILLAGDIEGPAEAELIRRGTDLRASVLKVPHHGSRTSSSEAFLNAVKPRVAVISVGERSRFGHPSPEVVKRLKDREMQILQTGREGMVTVETDGRMVETSSWRTNGHKRVEHENSHQ